MSEVVATVKRATPPTSETWGRNNNHGPARKAGWVLIGTYPVKGFLATGASPPNPEFTPDAPEAWLEHDKRRQGGPGFDPTLGFVDAALVPPIHPKTGKMAAELPSPRNGAERLVSVVALRSSVAT